MNTFARNVAGTGRSLRALAGAVLAGTLLAAALPAVAIPIPGKDGPHATEAAATPGDADAKAVERGFKVYKSAGCRTCHGWAGNGVGEGPSHAPSLRATTLDTAALRETVKCGRLGGGMPFFDRKAYKSDDRCYGLDQTTVGDLLPPRSSKGLNDNQIADLVSYLQAKVIGLPNEPDLAQCEAYWGEGHNFCRNYRVGQ